MRTRNNNWFNIKTNTVQFGFQVFSDGQWMDAAENGVPCIFDSEEDRNKKRAEFRSIKPSRGEKS